MNKKMMLFSLACITLVGANLEAASKKKSKKEKKANETKTKKHRESKRSSCGCSR